MGMDLLGNHGDERFSAEVWSNCLERAIQFGWQPEGTAAPPAWSWPGEWKWDGGYLSNDYQRVTDRDARALGKALLLAIDALSARANVQKRRAQIRLVSPIQPNVVGIERSAEWTEEEDSLEAEICCLRRLADFALKGRFVIA
jgi:hypothetical protein